MAVISHPVHLEKCKGFAVKSTHGLESQSRFEVNSFTSDTGSVLVFLPCFLWLCVRAAVSVDDIPCIYEFDPEDSWLSYSHKWKALFVVFLAVKYLYKCL